MSITIPAQHGIERNGVSAIVDKTIYLLGELFDGGFLKNTHAPLFNLKRGLKAIPQL